MFHVVTDEDFRNGTKQTVWDKISLAIDLFLLSRKQFKKNLPLGAQPRKLNSDHLLHAGYYARQCTCIICFGKTPISLQMN